MEDRRATLLTATLALLGGGLLWLATDGARAFTSEAARRLAIERAPRSVPHALLETATGELLESEQLRGTRWVIGFVYTRCTTVCPELVGEFGALQQALEERRAGRDVRLLSISFDPAHDTPARLAAYGAHFSPDPERWDFARIPDTGQLRRWLDTFGIVVVADGRGGFEHNAALHVVDESGRLVSVFDPDDVEGVLGRAVRAMR